MSAVIGRPKNRPDGMTTGAVLAYLQREADLDGLVTCSQQEIASAIGIEQPAAGYHLQVLRDGGLIVAAGRVQGARNHGIVAYQLSDEAMA